MAMVLLLPLAAAAAADGQAGKERPRLKFRDGPPCMCNDGLGEQAIREGERRWEWNRDKRDVPRPESIQDQTTKGE